MRTTLQGVLAGVLAALVLALLWFVDYGPGNSLHTVAHWWEWGLIGRVVGAPFAVLVAEELFASGWQLLVSITSARQLRAIGQPPYVVLIEQALRDEGTSYHYLPPAPYSVLSPLWRESIAAHWDQERLPLAVGTSWTTDAPFRETEQRLAWGRDQGMLAIEMEAAALYALATARNSSIVCFAHRTSIPFPPHQEERCWSLLIAPQGAETDMSGTPSRRTGVSRGGTGSFGLLLEDPSL